MAGPYSGNNIVNMRRAITIGTDLMDKGYAPFVPHLSGLWDIVTPRPYDTWLALDFEWIRACDCLLRIEGKSAGAEQEIELAISLGIPVYYSLDTLYACENVERP